MEPEEVFRRCENGISLFTATDDDLIQALKITARPVIMVTINNEIGYRRKYRKPTVVSGITNVRRKNRCPTKKDLR